MLRKKQFVQSKDAASRANAKVTVQYIQPQQQISTSTRSVSTNYILTTTSAEDVEIDNVEYLEESVATPADLNEDASGETKVIATVEELEDPFYPNAIHCLLDCYKDKYDNLTPSLNGYQMWRDIAKEMQESYFDFEPEQIRLKYSSLRRQYFDLSSTEEIENFDYFPQMHLIYNDASRQALANGEEVQKSQNQNVQHFYKDENIVNAVEQEDANVQDIQSKEIAHKEHEIIDMVEKELQALEDIDKQITAKPQSDNRTQQHNSRANEHSLLKINQPAKETNSKQHSTVLKRTISNASLEEEAETQPKQMKTERTSLGNEAKDIYDPPIAKDFSIFHYNEQQERRHREQMQYLQQHHQQQQQHLSLLEKQLRLQEQVFQQQSHLLQELIKRFPPS